MFPISIQDQEINVLLDTGAEKSGVSIDIFARLKLPINVAKVPKLRNASGKDMKMHGMVTVKFKMGNTIFTQEFVVCDDLVRPIIIGRDFTVNNFIGIAWTRHGTKKVIQEDKLVIAIEEPMRKRTLTTTRKVAIPPRNFVVFDLECKEWEGKYEIKPNPFLRQGEPNLWMDNFVLYNVPEKEDEVDVNEELRTQGQETTKDSEVKDPSEECVHEEEEAKKVCVPYCIFNLSYEHHSYIPKGSIVAFAKKEGGEETVFEVEEISGKEEYRNWVPKKKGVLPIPPKSDFICSPAEVSAHRKVKLESKSIVEDTAQKFEELCEHFPEVFSKNSEDTGRTNLITMDFNTGDHPPICQKPYLLALKHYEWVQKEVEQLEQMLIITRSVSPWASPIVIVLKKSAPDEPARRCMCIDFQRLNALQSVVVKVDSKAKGNLTLHLSPKIDELYAKLSGAKIFSALDLTSGYYHI